MASKPNSAGADAEPGPERDARYPNLRFEPPRKGRGMIIFKGRAKREKSKRPKSRNSDAKS